MAAIAGIHIIPKMYGALTVCVALSRTQNGASSQTVNSRKSPMARHEGRAYGAAGAPPVETTP